MKSSLLIAAVLMVVSHSAHADQKMPAYQPIQITSATGGLVAAIQVAPNPTAAPAAAPAKVPAPAPAPAPVIAAPKAPAKTSDSDSVAELKRAEAAFKQKKAVAAAPAKVTAPVAAPAPVTTRVSAPVVAKTPAVVAPARVVLRTSVSPAAPRSARAGVQPKSYANMDAAAILASQCLEKGARVASCMKLELDRAEAAIDHQETKLLNCRELRKLEAPQMRESIDTLVTKQMIEMRQRETQDFTAELTDAGRTSRLKTREIELRATLSHLNHVSAYASEVCSAKAFAKMMAAPVEATRTK